MLTTAVAVGKKIAAAWGNNVFADITDLYSTTIDTTIGTVGAGFTVSAQSARTMLGGKLVCVSLTIQSTAGITATTGNIPDTTCFTLDSAYWPSERIAVAWGVTVGGFGVINTNGTCVLWTASDNVAATTNIQFGATYLTA